MVTDNTAVWVEHRDNLEYHMLTQLLSRRACEVLEQGQYYEAAVCFPWVDPTRYQYTVFLGLVLAPIGNSKYRNFHTRQRKA